MIQDYIAVLRGGQVMSATNPHGLFSMLNGKNVDEVYALVGPFIPDLAEYIAGALPDAYIITSLEYSGNKPNIYAVTISEAQAFRPPNQIYILGTKGGVGKSTLAYLLALWISRYQCAKSEGVVLLADADSQAGLSLMIEESLSSERGQNVQITSLRAARLWKHPRELNFYVLLNQHGNTRIVPPYLIGGIMGGGWTIVDCGNDPNAIPPLDAHVVLLCEPGNLGVMGIQQVVDKLGGNRRITVVLTPLQSSLTNMKKNRANMIERLQRLLGNVLFEVEVFPLIPKDPWSPYLSQLETFLDAATGKLMQRIVEQATISVV